MKKKKLFIIIILLVQMIQFFINIQPTKAKISEGDEIVLLGDHECDSVLEFFMEEYGYWTYKVVYYVYYNDDGNRYPAFCVEPAKLGVGTGYDSYNAIINKVENMYENGEERLNQIWRILNKGYMGSSYIDWNLECDDDFYSATKIALHSLAQSISPVDKYVLGSTGVDGNPVEIVQRRGEKVLEVAQKLYEYGIYGSEEYEKPKVTIEVEGSSYTECINDVEYYIQNYFIKSNKELMSYDISINNFPKGTILLNLNNEEINYKEENDKNIKIAIPISQIHDDINGKIYIENANVKTKPVFYCKSLEEGAQSYVTFNKECEITNANTDLSISANTAKLLIKKVDEENNMSLSNVEFEILDNEKNKILDVKTNENGEIVLENMKPQTIYVREVKQKEGYVLNDDLIEVKLKYGKTSEINLTNTKQKGKIKIIKQDAENEKIKLENVEFEIRDLNNNIVDKVKTNKDGIGITKELPVGKYKIHELLTDKYYELNKIDQIVEVEYKKEKDIIINNMSKKGNVKIIKEDKEDNNIKLKGVEFEILDDKNNVLEKVITDESGIAYTKEYALKDYSKLRIREIKTLEGYKLNDSIIEVELKEKETQSVIIQNDKKEPEIEVPKLPRTGF